MTERQGERRQCGSKCLGQHHHGSDGPRTRKHSIMVPLYMYILYHCCLCTPLVIAQFIINVVNIFIFRMIIGCYVVVSTTNIYIQLNTFVMSAEVNDVCHANPTMLFQDSQHCAIYINCSATHFSMECKYPDLFSTKTNTCDKFETVQCGTRREPQAPCTC